MIYPPESKTSIGLSVAVQSEDPQSETSAQGWVTQLETGVSRRHPSEFASPPGGLARSGKGPAGD
jgi:hypothetical protein